METLDPKKLLEKAKKPAQDALALHPFFRGKVEVVPKCVVRNVSDFAIWYTPGVAAPCKDIQANPEKVFEHTNKGNFVAVISDGTRVLGLGDIGPEAAIPVMEGKALIFKYLGGVDAFPICVAEKDPDRFMEICLALQPTFGGFNLEDIAQPKCFYILETLRKEAHIPVWHDDQQGTAAVTVAGLINAARVVGKDFKELKTVMLGSGAAGASCLRVMIAAGMNPAKIRVLDLVDGQPTIIHPDMDLERLFPYRGEMLARTNADGIRGGMEEVFKGMDAVIGYAGPGLIQAHHIQSMASKPIIFACANPVPEIWPWEAKAAGAAVVGTGRSDFPNQVNNSLGFPGIFRGTLDVRAKTITDEMCLAAALELAKVAEDKGLHEDYIIPSMDEWEVFPREAAAVAMKAQEQGVAMLKKTREELFAEAETIIRRARDQLHILMEKGIVPPAPKS